MPKLSFNRVLFAVVLLATFVGSQALADEPMVLTETTEAFTYNRFVDEEPRFDFCDHEIPEHRELNMEPPVTPVAIAPLPPAVLTGAAMLIGGAVLRFVRNMRIS